MTNLLESKLRRALSESPIKRFLVKIGGWPYLVGGYQALKNPRLISNWVDVESDLKQFKKEFGFLSQLSPQKSAGKILVVNLSDSIFEAKMEGVLAKALQIHLGYEPVILTASDSTNATRYFKVFGFDQFILWDELIDQVFVPVGTNSPNNSFSELLQYQFRNVFVGRHVLSSAIRTLRHGTLDFSDPIVQEVLQQVLPKAKKAVLAAEKLMDKVKPEMVLFLEKGYSPYGELFDVAVNRKLNVVHWGHSHQKDSIVFKHYNPANRHFPNFSLSPLSWNRIQRSMPWNEQKELEFMDEIEKAYEDGTWFNRKFLLTGKKIKSPDEVRMQLGLDKNKKTAIIFSHVLWDATFFYGENLFKDYEDWLVETVKIAQENTNVNWVIKIHPDYIWKIKQLGPNAKPRDLFLLKTKIGKLKDHIKMMEPETDISTYSLFSVADYCITVRGTIGVEMSCFGVPVFTAGTGRYSEMGFTIDSKTKEEYLDKIRRIQEFPRMSEEERTLARKHAFALFKMRPFKFDSFAMIQMPLQKLGHLLDHNVAIHIRSKADFMNAMDLKKFSEWANRSNEEDFLEHL